MSTTKAFAAKQIEDLKKQTLFPSPPSIISRDSEQRLPKPLSLPYADGAGAPYAESQSSVLTFDFDIPDETDELGLEIIGGTDAPAYRDDDSVYVGRVSRGSIAGRDGRIRAGDRVLSVNGMALRSLSHDEVVSAFRSAKAVGRITMAIELAEQEMLQTPTVGMVSGREVLAKSLLKSYEEGTYTDCVVIAGTAEFQKRFCAHRIILASQSPVLRDLLFASEASTSKGTRGSASPPTRSRSHSQPHRKRSSKDKRNIRNGVSTDDPDADLSPTRSLLSETTAENSSFTTALESPTRLMEIELPELSPETCGHLLTFMYSGSLPALEDPHEYFRLISAAIRYKMQHMKSACELCLVRKIELKNICEFLLLAKRYNCAVLSKANRRFLIENFNLVSTSRKWASLKQRDSTLVMSTLEDLVETLLLVDGKPFYGSET